MNQLSNSEIITIYHKCVSQVEFLGNVEMEQQTRKIAIYSKLNGKLLFESDSIESIYSFLSGMAIQRRYSDDER